MTRVNTDRGGFIMSALRIIEVALVVLALLALAGCVRKLERHPVTETPTQAAATASPSPTPTSQVSPTTTTSPTSVTVPTSTPTRAGATVTATATQDSSVSLPSGLFLQITSIPKESVSRSSTANITGLTLPTAVVSVNGVLVDVDPAGQFSVSLSLIQGPNLVEINASDLQGNRMGAVLTIIYVP